VRKLGSIARDARAALSLLLCVLLNGCGVHVNPAAPSPTPAWVVAPGDLRFKGIGQSLTLRPALSSTLSSFESDEYAAAYPAPLSIGGNICAPSASATITCSWGYFVASSAHATPLTIDAMYLSNPLAQLASPASPTSAVIGSLDVQPVANAFAESAIVGSAQTFLPSLQHIALADLDRVLQEAGGQGNVATAISTDAFGTTAWLYLYGWQADPQSSYDTTVTTATYATLQASAQTLAQQGYIVTACGGNDAAGFTLIGTRLSGTSAPRTLGTSLGSTTNSDDTRLLAAGYALVASVQGTGADNFLRLYEN
jgi:hypothetical protein